MLQLILDDTEVLCAIATSKKQAEDFVQTKNFDCRIEEKNVEYELDYKETIKEILLARQEEQHIRIKDEYHNVSSNENDILSIAQLSNRDLKNEKLFVTIAEVTGGRSSKNKNDYNFN